MVIVYHSPQSKWSAQDMSLFVWPILINHDVCHLTAVNNNNIIAVIIIVIIIS